MKKRIARKVLKTYFEYIRLVKKYNNGETLTRKELATDMPYNPFQVQKAIHFVKHHFKKHGKDEQ